ncbi:MAG: Cytosine deaminase-like protein [Ignavibacteria bacterium]|nr:MAG: Cytosine deaminase-like protein [Ignavibacteria bacterium]KAF0161321.1 MAG: Cytosine deaminase-like protein [Ignavibacteria bacterium]
MKAKLIIPKQVVTVNNNNDVFVNHAVEISNGVITKIEPVQNFVLSEYEVLNYQNYVLIPGFVQTHIHLCQTLFRGFADDLELLDWLQKRIFPFENSHNKNSLRISVQLGINDLLAGGTTTLLDMGTLRHQEVIFEELIYSGMRAFAGNCMIDQNNLFSTFSETTDWNLKASYDWAKSFHNLCSGKIKYGFAPRFVLSCSEKLLKETKEMMKDFPGSVLHTHSSENKNEVETVRDLTGKENVEYFDSIGLLDDHTVLAHCIHLNENEIKSLKNNKVKISHCPSSNLKLGSGVANVPRFIKEGISVSLGADGAPCNNSLSAFTEMRHAGLIQKPIYGPTAMDALTVFRLATMEGAKALHLEKEVGSIEVGKKADFVLLDLDKADQPIQMNEQSIYSSIVYSATKENVKAVFVDGELKVESGKSVIYDEQKLTANGKNQFEELLKRVN